MFFGKPIFVCYPQNTGGKFLINCLGLSDHALLSDIELVKQQLTTNFTKQNKLDFLLGRLEQVSGEWNDLLLGKIALFGQHSEFTLPLDAIDQTLGTFYNSIYPSDNFHLSPYKDLIINSDKTFLIESHGINETLYYYNLWDDVQIILFKDNFNLFLNFRLDDFIVQLKKSWETIKGSSWPQHCPSNSEEYNRLSSDVKKEIEQFGIKYTPVKFNWTVEKLNYTNYISWDADIYLLETEFIKEISRLYSLLGFTDFDENIIITYYRAWISKLTELKINN